MALRWTAVVRGAVLYGIEKMNHKEVTYMRTCPKSYGIVLNEVYSGAKFDRQDQYTDSLTNNVMAQMQLSWLIRKGDLLLSNTKKEAEKEFIFPFQNKDDLKFKMPIYEYPDDDLPYRFQTGQQGAWFILMKFLKSL